MPFATIPIPEKVSANAIYAGMHWAKRKKLVDLYHQALVEYRARKIDTPCRLVFNFTFKGRALDADNCVFMAKMCIDGMRAWGMIEDDTPEHIAAITISSIKGASDLITITALEG